MIQITMPRLSDTMEEGSILTWHKKPGDAVNVGDLLVEIETDKATMEYEAYEAGTLSKIIAAEGELVSIGAPIAELEGGEGDASAASKPDEDQEPEIESVGSEQHASERRFASPLVRKIAREHNLDLSEIRGTGPGGRVIRTDIEVLLEEGAASGRATEQQTPSALAPATAGSARTDQNRSLAPAGDKRDSEAVPLNQVRRVIARRLRGERA